MTARKKRKDALDIPFVLPLSICIVCGCHAGALFEDFTPPASSRLYCAFHAPKTALPLEASE